MAEQPTSIYGPLRSLLVHHPVLAIGDQLRDPKEILSELSV
jgi:hypothetical protein